MTITRATGQTTGTHAEGATSITLAYPNAVTAGNLLVIGCGKGNTTSEAFTVGMVSQSAGSAVLGTPLMDKTTVVFSSPYYLNSVIYSIPVTGSGTCTIRVAWVNSADSIIGLQEYSGTDVTGSRIDGTSSQTGSTALVDSGSVTSTAGGVFYGTMMILATDGTITKDGAFTTVYNQPNESYATGSIEDRIVTTSTQDTASWTSKAVAWSAVLAVYKEAGGGGGSQIVSGCANLSGFGADNPISLLNLLALSSFPGQGNIIPTSYLTRLGISSLLGTGNIIPNANLLVPLIATLAGNGYLSGTAINSAIANAILNGNGNLSANALLTILASLALGGKGDLSSIPVLTINGLSTLSGLGDLLASGTVGGVANVINGSAILDGQGYLTPNALNILNAQLALYGTGNLDGQPQLTINALSTLEGIAFLIATGIVGVLAPTVEGQAILAGQGDLILTALNIVNGGGLLTGESILSAQSLLNVLCNAILNGEGNTQANAILLINAIGALYGAGALIPIGTISGLVLPITPGIRSFIIQGENRIFVIDSEGRIFLVKSENRIQNISE